MFSATWKRSAWLLWLALCCSGSVLGCSDTSEATGGDTHWLQMCTEDADCERGACLCGVCTESCTRDAQCAGGVEAQCIDTASPAIAGVCANGVEPTGEAPGICLASCAGGEGDVACTDGLECNRGVCTPASSAPTDAAVIDAAMSDAAQPLGAVSARPSMPASEFADLAPSASLSFDDDVVPVPEPERSFSDPAEALLGKWSQPDCDPADSETQFFFGGGCVTLLFERTGPSGAIVGRVDADGEATPPPWDALQQGFASAVDPDIGYPIEVEPEAYKALGNDPMVGPYTMLDPHFDGEVLQFWVSPLEVWEGWCGLQTSYRAPGSTPAYQCVPDGAAYGDPEVDRGKLALCTSSWSSGACDPKTCGVSGTEPCPPDSHSGCGCFTPDGFYDEERPECSIAYCRCDAEGCAPNWYERRIDFQLLFDGDRLIGREGLRGGGYNMGVLQREVTP